MYSIAGMQAVTAEAGRIACAAPRWSKAVFRARQLHGDSEVRPCPATHRGVSGGSSSSGSKGRVAGTFGLSTFVSAVTCVFLHGHVHGCACAPNILGSRQASAKLHARSWWASRPCCEESQLVVRSCPLAVLGMSSAHGRLRAGALRSRLSQVGQHIVQCVLLSASGRMSLSPPTISCASIPIWCGRAQIA